MSKAAKTAKKIPSPYAPIQAHYDGGRKSFWTTNDRGGWIGVNEASLRRLLRECGYENRIPSKELVSPLDKKLNEIQTKQDIAYAGALAGYRSGLVEICGQRILVTSSPKLIEPKAGDWPVLQRFFDSLLYDSHYDQRSYVYAWLKLGYEALHAGIIRTAPATGLAGAANCGKSFAQKIFTEILGGRSAKPYRYMSGNTQFNADLFGAEHLVIEDEHSSTDIRARRALGSNIKQVTANQVQSCHEKGRTALSLTPFWRLSISVNDEPEALMVLPPLDSDRDGLSDKIILLNVQQAEMPLPIAGNEAWEQFWNTLTAELPAFIDFLTKWEIPEELVHSRFGMKTWQHPRLVAALDALAPETRLLSLIDGKLFTSTKIGQGVTVSFEREGEFWRGTAEKLEKELCGDYSDCKHEARRLLNWSSACGTYLARLAHKHPARVKDARTGKSRDWIIYPPEWEASATPASDDEVAELFALTEAA